MKIVVLVMWYSPFGIMSLIIGKIMSIEDLASTAAQLGLYMVTVVLGLLIHAVVTLPGIFFIITKMNPFNFFKGMLQAWITALGTASRSALLELTQTHVARSFARRICSLEKLFVPPQKDLQPVFHWSIGRH